MKIAKIKLTRWTALAALAIIITAVGSAEGQSQQPPGLDDCPQMKKYEGNDRHIEIDIGKDGKVSIDPEDEHKVFWHKDTLSWKIVNHPNNDKEISDFEIEFKDSPGVCETEKTLSKSWPCKKNWWSRKWKRGAAEEDADDTISCKIRKNALGQWYEKHPGSPVKNGWKYCYVITVKFGDGSTETLTADNKSKDKPAGGGGGCGSCHTDTAF